MNNVICEPDPGRRSWPRLGWTAAALVLLCFVPRAGLALRKTVICRDGVFYLQLAEALGDRDWSRGFNTLGLNVYPGLLAAAQAVGLEPAAAGKWWGVFIASVAVLPLFGWVRRLFNDRTAWTVAILYAAHPKLIEWSPELVRDPTFWCLWSTSIYCLVRAVSEGRLAWFALGGAAVALAIHTRFEGWLLYLPFGAWIALRAWRLATERRPLARGAVLGLAMYPALLVLVNVTWLRDCPEWQLGSFQRLQYVRWWWAGEAPQGARLPLPYSWRPANANSPRNTSTNSAAVRPIAFERLVATNMERAPSWRFTLEYLDALRRGFDLGYGLLAAWGIWRGRGLWRRPDYHALLAVGIAIFGAIWIHFWYAGATSSRYVLTVLLLALPWTALGILDLVAICAASGAARRLGQLASPRSVYVAAMAVCLIVGSARGMTSRDHGLAREAALGRWLGETLGPDTPVALARTMPLCAYYAGATRHVTWLDTRDPGWVAFLAHPELQVAIVDSQAMKAAGAAGLGGDWARLTSADLPAECRPGSFTVLMRRNLRQANGAHESPPANSFRDDAAMRRRKAPVAR